MIIKVYCSDNTCKIITDIQDINIHLPRYAFSNAKECSELYSPDFGPTTSYILENGRDSIHYYENLAQTACFIGDIGCKIIDYRTKDHGWQRLIVDCWAYVCNDEGKTLEKVEP